MISALFDIIVSIINLRTLKGRLPNKQGVGYNADGPNIYFKRMALIFVFTNNFWGQVIGSSTEWVSSFAWLNSSWETEVTDLNLHVVVQEQVTKLDVPVDNLLAVHILHPRDQLLQVVHHLELCQLFPFSENSRQIGVFAKF